MSGPDGGPRWSLVLYVIGSAPRSLASVAGVRALCDARLGGNADLEVVDMRLRPGLAEADGVIVVPTLIRRAPPPLRRITGDFTDPVWLGDQLGIDGALARAADRAAGD